MTPAGPNDHANHEGTRMDLSDVLDRGDFVAHHTIPVILSADAANAVIAAEDRLAEVQTQLTLAPDDTDTADLQAAVDDAQAELETAMTAAEAHLVDFTVQSISAGQWQRLVEESPPTPQQRALHGPTLDHNPDTLPIRAIHACLTDPKPSSINEVRTLSDRLPEAVWQQLWTAVLYVNIHPTPLPTALASRLRDRQSG